MPAMARLSRQFAQPCRQPVLVLLPRWYARRHRGQRVSRRITPAKGRPTSLQRLLEQQDIPRLWVGFAFPDLFCRPIHHTSHWEVWTREPPSTQERRHATVCFTVNRQPAGAGGAEIRPVPLPILRPNHGKDALLVSLVSAPDLVVLAHRRERHGFAEFRVDVDLWQLRRPAQGIAQGHLTEDFCFIHGIVPIPDCSGPGLKRRRRCRRRPGQCWTRRSRRSTGTLRSARLPGARGRPRPAPRRAPHADRPPWATGPADGA